MANLLRDGRLARRALALRESARQDLARGSSLVASEFAQNQRHRQTRRAPLVSRERGRRDAGRSPPEARRSPIAGLTRARAETARYLCSRCRRLPADAAPMRALGSGEGDRAAGPNRTIEIVAKQSRDARRPPIQ